MTAGGGPLEPDANGMRALLANVSERIVRELEALPAQRASDTEGGQAVALKVREPLPEQGRKADDVFDLVFGELLSKGYNTASAGTLSYVTGGGLFHSAVGELIAAATNRYVAYWAASRDPNSSGSSAPRATVSPASSSWGRGTEVRSL